MPNNSSGVVVLLDGGGDNTSNADAIAAHLNRACPAVPIQNCGIHGIAVFTSQLKDVTDLNSSGDGEWAAAGRTRVAGNSVAKIGANWYGEVPRPGDTGEMMIGLICPADEVRQA